ncbi:MAG: N-acetylmuramoyl-L-alanine amidase [Lachnospiraceae bacterium]|nr:N-acetylmuramoyl-L-alanine amidase [Lachnospiraceae bacterium]
MTDNRNKKRLLPSEKRRRRRIVMLNRTLFGIVCLLLLAFITYTIHLVLGFIFPDKPAEYVISGNEVTTEASQADSANTAASGSNTNGTSLHQDTETDVFNDEPAAHASGEAMNNSNGTTAASTDDISLDYPYSLYHSKTICLDAGHGGSDTGAHDSKGSNESDQNLTMVLTLKEELEKYHFNVVLTRSTDEFVSLQERCSIANNASADLLISIHRNSFPQDSTICGVEAWVCSTKPAKDTAIAQKIINSLEKVYITGNRGVRYGARDIDDGEGEDYIINKASNMPSLLLEMGYMSNSEDNLLFDVYMKEYCQAIARGLADYCLNNK